ncbi:MAG: ankyrin repeat domain-containing protein [Verrucomicrobiales bacterium]
MKSTEFPVTFRIFLAVAAAGCAAIFLTSCGDSQQAAVEELGEAKLAFTVDDFMGAAKEGNAEALKLYLDGGMEPDVPGENGETALVHAAAGGHAAAVALLLERGAAPNLAADGGRLPLIEAAKIGSAPAIKALLDAKADPAATDPRQWTALAYAAFNGHAEALRALPISHSKELDEALLLSAIAGNPAAIDALLERGASVYSRSPEENRTPLMYAAAHGHEEAVRLLLARDSNRYAIDAEGKTPADLAAAAGYAALADLLSEPPADAAIPLVPADPVGADEAFASIAQANASPADPFASPGEPSAAAGYPAIAPPRIHGKTLAATSSATPANPDLALGSAVPTTLDHGGDDGHQPHREGIESTLGLGSFRAPEGAAAEDPEAAFLAAMRHRGTRRARRRRHRGAIRRRPESPPNSRCAFGYAERTLPMRRRRPPRRRGSHPPALRKLLRAVLVHAGEEIADTGLRVVSITQRFKASRDGARPLHTIDVSRMLVENITQRPRHSSSAGVPIKPPKPPVVRHQGTSRLRRPSTATNSKSPPAAAGPRPRHPPHQVVRRSRQRDLYHASRQATKIKASRRCHQKPLRAVPHPPAPQSSDSLPCKAVPRSAGAFRPCACLTAVEPGRSSPRGLHEKQPRPWRRPTPVEPPPRQDRRRPDRAGRLARRVGRGADLADTCMGVASRVQTYCQRPTRGCASAPPVRATPTSLDRFGRLVSAVGGRLRLDRTRQIRLRIRPRLQPDWRENTVLTSGEDDTTATTGALHRGVRQRGDSMPEDNRHGRHARARRSSPTTVR